MTARNLIHEMTAYIAASLALRLAHGGGPRWGRSVALMMGVKS